MSNQRSVSEWVDFLTKYAEEIIFEGSGYKLVSPEDADEIAAELEALRADAERYRWLRDNAKEELLYPQRAGGEVPDLRTKWSIPTLMCGNCIGGWMSFDESVDAARGES